MNKSAIQEEIRVLREQWFPEDKERIVSVIVKSSEDDPEWAMYLAYCYGVMEGKREEREKRKLKCS